MHPPITTFWGKLEKNDQGEVLQWHLLEAHCADVAACAERLLLHTVLGQRFATLANVDTLTEKMIQRYSALAALHDVGKFNHGFQRKAQIDPSNTAGHVSEFLASIPLRRPKPLRFSGHCLVVNS